MNLESDKNYLFYGDNLDVLRRYIPDESVDLVYLDPPFKSNQDYNILFEEKDGTESAAQILAFEDTWKWDTSAVAAYEDVLTHGGAAARALKAFRDFLGTNDMMAYLAMMAPRLIELRRVMKPTASIYLHCDPTASHYLKMLMDAVFGAGNFRNEITWKRTSAHNDPKRYGNNADCLLFFAKTNSYTWNPLLQPYSDKYIASHYRYTEKDTGRKYRLSDLTAAGISGGPSGKPWKGVDPTTLGRHWAIPNWLIENHSITANSTQEKLDALDALGYIHWPEKGKFPAYRRYIDEVPGTPLQVIWDDIPPINSQAKERLGYPTQKPEALLERIIQASSNECDTVLDPFCGCGTTVAAAQKLNRRWIGIDITHLSISLIKHRLFTAYGEDAKYIVTGEPVDTAGAAALADQDKFQFEWWALGLVGARPFEQRKGADRGIDGVLYFHDEGDRGRTKSIVLSVKGGHVQVSHIRDLRGVIEREEAEIGVLITLNPPTAPMRTEAADAGFYTSPTIAATRHPRIQILTIDELLKGARIDYPGWGAGNVTLRRAPRAGKKKDNAGSERLI